MNDFNPYSDNPPAPAEPRRMEDPAPVGTILRSAIDNLTAHWKSEFARDPANTWEPGKCKFCGCTLDEPLIVGSDLIQFPTIACDPCINKERERRDSEDRVKAESAFAKVIPIEFSFWDTHKGNNAALAKAQSNFNISSRKGLVLHGLTGTCKTRIMWQLVKRVIEQPEGYSWLMLNGFEIATSATPFPKEAFFCDFLFIDDLGNSPSSTKFVTSLLHLIRRRCNWHRPIIVTTQLTGDAFRQRFFNNPAASAIVRRFRDRTNNLQT